ncbi:MAG: class II glutamine amidotransferase, partial [Myxococcales bacterium]|nr:class II glutamine amidotransferase [Myxococcales bacterium]
MCQLLGVSSSSSAWLALRWTEFMARGSASGGNPDGWGVAAQLDDDVSLVREPEPAASSEAVRFLESNGPPSRLIVSHIRRATQGARSLANTQPFVRRLWGRAHVFAHNGSVDLPDPGSAEAWTRPIGQTDSERAFCVLLSRLAPLWRSGSTPPLDERVAVVDALAAELRGRGAVNFLYWDG